MLHVLVALAAAVRKLLILVAQHYHRGKVTQAAMVLAPRHTALEAVEVLGVLA
jgi:hypothetical protein